MKRLILHFGKRHPSELGTGEVEGSLKATVCDWTGCLRIWRVTAGSRLPRKIRCVAGCCVCIKRF
ncbi:MAG: hypothetical protein ACRERV_08000 [Methylococcales bacterium]